MGVGQTYKKKKKTKGRKDAKKKKKKKKKTSISQLRNHLRHGLRFSRTTWLTQGRTSRPLNSEAGSIILVCSYIKHKRWLANFVIIFRQRLRFSRTTWLAQ